MNRKTKEKSALREEGVPPSAVAPSKYKPMEVDAINQVADGREQRQRVTFDCNNSTF